MSNAMIATMVLYSLGMACGQLLFKLAATSSTQERASSSLLGFVNPYLLGGIALYGGLTIMWVWILRSVPLSKAYPFVALSFIFTPMFSKFFLNESLSTTYYLGLLLIAAGVIVIARG